MGWRSSRNWFGAVILIAVGVVGLVVNFDLIPAQIIDQLWKLWPLIPLAIGVRMFFGRSYYWDNRPPREAGKS